MMKYFSFILMLSMLVSCSTTEKKSLPPSPAGVAEVKKIIGGKTYINTKLGKMPFTISTEKNPQDEIEWIDVATEKDKMTVDVISAEKKFSLKFLNDTAVTVITSDTTYAGTYEVDNEVGDFDDGREGVKLRISYADPKFAMPGGLMDKVTYTFHVKGIDEKQLYLELPREINRRKIVSLMESVAQPSK